MSPIESVKAKLEVLSNMFVANSQPHLLASTALEDLKKHLTELAPTGAACDVLHPGGYKPPGSVLPPGVEPMTEAPLPPLVLTKEDHAMIAAASTADLPARIEMPADESEIPLIVTGPISPEIPLSGPMPADSVAPTPDGEKIKAKRERITNQAATKVSQSFDF